MMGKYREWNLWHGESQTLCKGERYPGENIPVIETKAVDDWREMAEKLAKQILEIKKPAEVYKPYGWADRGRVIQKTNALLIEYEQFKKEFL